jgi:hypothetical protein
MTIRRLLASSVAAFLSITLSILSIDIASADVVQQQETVYQRRSELEVDQHLTSDNDGATNSNPTSWEGLSFVIHRNGEPHACGAAIPPPLNDLLTKYELNIMEMDKYDVESFLTQVFGDSLVYPPACATPDNATAPKDLFHFCDLGPDRTPILLDHEELVRLEEGTLPCRWYTREGLRIASLEQLLEIGQVERMNAQTCTPENSVEGLCTGTEPIRTAILHLYGVPAGRVFMFAPEYVGEIFELNHISQISDPDKPIYLKVLSLDPRVFDIYNYFSTSEADDIVQRALAETSPSHRMHRSTTGTTENAIFNKRTSENAFDTHGVTALAVKK